MTRGQGGDQEDRHAPRFVAEPLGLDRAGPRRAHRPRGLAACGALGLLGLSPEGGGVGVVVPRLIVDPNEAPPGVLGALPKLGPTLVARILEARRESPLRSLDDLDARVRGIGPATIEALRPHVRFGPPEDNSPPPTGPRMAPNDR